MTRLSLFSWPTKGEKSPLWPVKYARQLAESLVNAQPIRPDNGLEIKKHSAELYIVKGSENLLSPLRIASLIKPVCYRRNGFTDTDVEYSLYSQSSVLTIPFGNPMYYRDWFPTSPGAYNADERSIIDTRRNLWKSIYCKSPPIIVFIFFLFGSWHPEDSAGDTRTICKRLGQGIFSTGCLRAPSAKVTIHEIFTCCVVFVDFHADIPTARRIIGFSQYKMDCRMLVRCFDS